MKRVSREETETFNRCRGFLYKKIRMCVSFQALKEIMRQEDRAKEPQAPGADNDGCSGNFFDSMVCHVFMS